jgi:hypothetical protein
MAQRREPQWLVQFPHGPKWVKASDYVWLFGSTREERAENMEARDLFLRAVPGRPSVYLAPSQAREQEDVYTVSKHLGRLCSCTCADFQRHAPYDDTFACKHMLLRLRQHRASP